MCLATVRMAALALAHAVCLAALLTVCAPALAAPSVEPEAYRTLVSEAIAEFDAGRYQESRALFMQAHQLFPNARTLRGLGMTEFELRNYAECIRNLDAALASQVRPLEGTLRDETERLLTRARAFVARISLTLSPPGARVAVDGIPVQVGAGQALLLSVGEHVLDVQADGYAAERRVLSLKSSGDQALTIQLRSLSGAAQPSPQPLAQPAPVAQRAPASARPLTALPPPAWQGSRPTALPAPTPVAAGPRAAWAPPAPAHKPAAPVPATATSKPSRTGAWVLTGISAAVAVGGAVLLGLGAKDISKVEDAADGTRWSDVDGAYDRAPRLTAAGITLGVVGAVGLVSGLVWGLHRPSADRQSSRSLIRKRLLLASLGRF